MSLELVREESHEGGLDVAQGEGGEERPEDGAAPLREEGVDGEEKADEEEEEGVAHGVEQAVAEERLVIRLQDVAQVAERRDGGRGRGGRVEAHAGGAGRADVAAADVAAESRAKPTADVLARRRRHGGGGEGLPERFAADEGFVSTEILEASKYPSSFATSGASRSANAPRLAPDERRGDEFFANDIGARRCDPGARATPRSSRAVQRQGIVTRKFSDPPPSSVV